MSDMTFRKKLRDKIKSVYVKGCLDSLDDKNKGKGKELCEETTLEAEQRIIDLVREIVGEEATWENPDPDIQHGSNDRREKILQRLEEK